MGVYKDSTGTTGIYKVVGQVGFVRVGKIRGQGAESEELKTIFRTMLGVRL